jgi:hypothetical protein
VLLDEFLDSIANKTDHPNVQIRLLETLLKGEVRSRSRTNRTQAKLFTEQIPTKTTSTPGTDATAEASGSASAASS